MTRLKQFCVFLTVFCTVGCGERIRDRDNKRKQLPGGQPSSVQNSNDNVPTDSTEILNKIDDDEAIITSLTGDNASQAFDNVFPKLVLFRPERFSPSDSSPDVWVRFAPQYSILIGKAVEDEFRSAEKAAERAVRLQLFKDKFPDRLVLAHHNGDGFNPELLAVSRRLNKPSDWVHYPGVDSITDIKANYDKICIPIEALDKFADGRSDRCVGYSRETVCAGDDVSLVERTTDGKLNYESFEYAKVAQLFRGTCPHKNVESIVMTLIRGNDASPMYGTRGRAYDRAYVAPLVVEGPYGDAHKDAVKMWVPNFARNESRIITDSADVFAEMFSERALEAKAALGGIDGVTLDVSDESLRTLSGDRRQPDVNWDGKSDDGIFHNNDNWREGRAEFYRRLRAAVGDRVLIADGGAYFNQKSINDLDGIEAEKFTPGDRLLSEFSSGVNRILYWQLRPKKAVNRTFSYVVNKIDSGMAEDHIKSRSFLRMMAAYQTILGLGVALGSYGANALTIDKVFPKCLSDDWTKKMVPLDELVGGDLNNPRWLGKAENSIKRLALRHADLLRGSGREMSKAFVESIQSPNSKITAKRSMQASTLVIEPKPNAFDLKFTIRGMPIASNSDITVVMDVRAMPRTTAGRGYESYLAIPRTLTATIADKSLLADNQSPELSGLMGVYGSGDFRRIVFTWRTKVKHSVSNTDIQLVAEDVGPIEIRNLTVHAAPDAMARAYENGVIVANMSRNHSIRLSLEDLFGKRKLNRLKSTGCQNDGVNDGRAVGSNMVLGPEQGLFLRNR